MYTGVFLYRVCFLTAALYCALVPFTTTRSGYCGARVIILSVIVLVNSGIFGEGKKDEKAWSQANVSYWRTKCERASDSARAGVCVCVYHIPCGPAGTRTQYEDRPDRREDRRSTRKCSFLSSGSGIRTLSQK